MSLGPLVDVSVGNTSWGRLHIGWLGGLNSKVQADRR